MNFLSSLLGSKDDAGQTRSRLATNPNFDFKPLFDLGLASAPTAIAHDPVQSLLATACADGSVLVCGRDSVKRVLTPHPAAASSPILLVRFKLGDKILLAVNSRNQLVAWNLATAAPQFDPVQLNSAVTSLEISSASQWAFLGLASGHVAVIDCATGFLSADYGVPPLDPERVSPVVTLQVHPADENSLLIAYAAGLGVIWDVRERAVARRFALGPAEQLVSASWRHDGSQLLLVGVDMLSFWSRKEGWLDGLKKDENKKPLTTRSLAAAGSAGSLPRKDSAHSSVSAHLPPKEAIRKAVWARNGPAESILIAAATLPDEPHGLVALEFSDSQKDMRTEKSRLHFPVGPAIVDFVLIPTTDPALPSSIVILTSEGTLQAHDLSPSFPLLSLPPTLAFCSGPEILFATFARCTELLAYEIRSLAAASAQSSHNGSRPLPLTGGTFQIRSGRRVNDLIITAHVNSELRLWLPESPPLTVCVRSIASRTEITSVEVHASAGSLLVVIGPRVVLFRFVTAAEVTAANREVTETDIAQLMEQLDNTVDEVLKLSAANVGRAGEDGSEVEGAKGMVAADREGEQVNAGGTDGGLEPDVPDVLPEEPALAPPRPDRAEAPLPLPPRPSANTPPIRPHPAIASASTHTPPPQENSPGPPLPPRKDEPATPRSQTPPPASPLPPPLPPRRGEVVIESLEDPAGRLEAPGFMPVLQAVFSELIVGHSYAPWLRLYVGGQGFGGGVGGYLVRDFGGALAVITDSGRLIIVDLASGEDILCETVSDSPEPSRKATSPSTDGPAKVGMVKFVETYFEQERTTRPCLLAFTKRGTGWQYGIYHDPETGKPYVVKTFLQIAKTPSRPLLPSLLSDTGRILHAPTPHTSRPTQSSEQYLVVPGGTEHAVTLLEGGAKPEIIKRVSVRGKDAAWVCAGVGKIKADPSLMSLTATSVLQAFTLPSLDMIWEDRLPSDINLTWIDSAVVLEEGRIWLRAGERRVVGFGIGNDDGIQHSEPKLYDATRASAWARSKGLRVAGAKNPEMDQLCKFPGERGVFSLG
ncbi:hypothetical protein BDK51DRAFT_49291 [Blyttiomyces helicus]|uniref:Lethal giant larvae (Lgl)-like C-terminal domain-containing protein n=1 Tax=Blyttiomyces helicus TaxID=388810 RepID=A0A4P9WAH3_9FUNG|nr:hypothetical protein BDK51DRAFT_49291 [Blyttiomyces helicus]|eukprot:RKO88555.1 hypothetical protein BDK51DRAFT_49291 [Blyttiomyces helicus]